MKDWEGRRAAVSERLGGASHNALEGELNDAEAAAENRLLAICPPDLHGLVYLTRMYIKNCHLETAADDPDNADTISRLISHAYLPERFAGHLYRHLLIMTRTPRGTLDAEVFDAEAWTAGYESSPGHFIDEQGAKWNEDAGPEDPAAWPRGASWSRGRRTSFEPTPAPGRIAIGWPRERPPPRKRHVSGGAEHPAAGEVLGKGRRRRDPVTAGRCKRIARKIRRRVQEPGDAA